VSLIEEALRKQQEEADKTKGTGVRLSVAPPPQTPPANAAETAPPPLPEDEPVRRAWPVLLGIIVGGIVLIGGIAWLLLFGLGLWKAKPQARLAKPAPSVAASPVAPSETGKVAVAAVPVAVPAPTSAPPVVVPVQPAPPPTVTAVVTDTPPVVAAGPQVAAASGSVAAVVATAPAKEAVIEAEGVPVVIWPKLTVTGLIGSSRSGRSAAIINKQMVEPGAVVEGVKVEAIDKKGVRLRYQGETRTLALGGTTE